MPKPTEVPSDLTLESFVVTPATRFAHAVAASVVSFPGDLYNPVLLYGPAGAGKTHLLQGIAAGLPDHDVRLLSAAELAETVRDEPSGLADADVLLVDDVESSLAFAAIRETLTDFLTRGRQVVVATRGDSDAFDELWSWGAHHDRALAADCRPFDAENFVSASQIAALVAKRTNAVT